MIFSFHRLFPEPAIFGGLFICLWLRQAISYKVKNEPEVKLPVQPGFVYILSSIIFSTALSRTAIPADSKLPHRILGS